MGGGAGFLIIGPGGGGGGLLTPGRRWAWAVDAARKQASDASTNRLARPEITRKARLVGRTTIKLGRSGRKIYQNPKQAMAYGREWNYQLRQLSLQPTVSRPDTP
jgi:hypothetical protein